MFFLQYVLISLMLTVVASDLDTNRDKCKQKHNIRTGCVLRKVKWFYRRNKDNCVQRLTCRDGFDHRLECERLCIDPVHTTSATSMDLLNEIFSLITKSQTTIKSRRRTTQQTTQQTTRKSSTSTKSTTLKDSELLDGGE